MQMTESSVQPSTAASRQLAAKLGPGAHLALAVCYLQATSFGVLIQHYSFWSICQSPVQVINSSVQPSTAASRQLAAKLRLGAHLALAVCYLPLNLPHPQDQLHVRTDQEVEDEPNPEAITLSTSEDLAVQVCAAWLSVYLPASLPA